jgi:hypothetical protein
MIYYDINIIPIDPFPNNHRYDNLGLNSFSTWPNDNYCINPFSIIIASFIAFS